MAAARVADDLMTPGLDDGDNYDHLFRWDHWGAVGFQMVFGSVLRLQQGAHTRSQRVECERLSYDLHSWGKVGAL